jgi:hypothetical protein
MASQPAGQLWIDGLARPLEAFAWSDATGRSTRWPRRERFLSQLHSSSAPEALSAAYGLRRPTTRGAHAVDESLRGPRSRRLASDFSHRAGVSWSHGTMGSDLARTKGATSAAGRPASGAHLNRRLLACWHDERTRAGSRSRALGRLWRRSPRGLVATKAAPDPPTARSKLTHHHPPGWCLSLTRPVSQRAQTSNRCPAAE